VVQVAVVPVSAAGFPPEQVRLVPPSMNVTVPVAPAVTVAVSTVLEPAPLVKGVVGFGDRVVVVGVDAAL
jgi:hypothetical protein